MTHLSTTNSILAMIFYSILTFGITPMITRPYFKKHSDPCIAGFLVGFTISILLWMTYGKVLTKNNL